MSNGIFPEAVQNCKGIFLSPITNKCFPRTLNSHRTMYNMRSIFYSTLFHMEFIRKSRSVNFQNVHLVISVKPLISNLIVLNSLQLLERLRKTFLYRNLSGKIFEPLTLYMLTLVKWNNVILFTQYLYIVSLLYRYTYIFMYI